MYPVEPSITSTEKCRISFHSVCDTDQFGMPHVLVLAWEGILQSRIPCVNPSCKPAPGCAKWKAVPEGTVEVCR